MVHALLHCSDLEKVSDQDTDNNVVDQECEESFCVLYYIIFMAESV